MALSFATSAENTVDYRNGHASGVKKQNPIGRDQGSRESEVDESSFGLGHRVTRLYFSGAGGGPDNLEWTWNETSGLIIKYPR